MKKLLLLLLLLTFTGFVCGCRDKTPPIDSGEETEVKPIRPHNHAYTEYKILTQATFFAKGSKSAKCTICETEKIEDYYYLDEVSFENTTYQFNGTERTLEVRGILPKGIHVEYLDNKRTSIGTNLAKAHFLDDNQNIVETREAALIITEAKGLPTIQVNTYNAQIDSKEIYTSAAISLTNCDSADSLVNISGGIRLRGNGTLESPKKPYRIKFDKKQNILGLNDGLKAKSWVLLAEYYDYSFFRNATAFMMGDALFNHNDNYFSSDFAFVNLSINGIPNGIYVLAEQSQVNEGRVNINEPATNDTSLNVGYLTEIDLYAYNEGDYFTVGNSRFGIKSDYYSLKSDYYSKEQKEYIEKYMNSVFEILYYAAVKREYYELGANFELVASSETSCFATINKVMDVESFIRSYILEEIIKDIDVGYSSYYLYVDFSEGSKINRLTTSVPWDFDWSSGNANGTYATNGKYNSNVFDHMNVWLYLISKCDFFDEMMSDYYTLFRNSKVMEQIYDYQNYVTSTFQADFSNNFRKWNVLGSSLHSYHSNDVFSIRSHADAVGKLQTWLKARIAYLDQVYYKGDS